MENAPNEPVPLHLRNAPTELMKDLGYGQGYRYAHDHPEGVVDMNCLPESLAGHKYYHPSEEGMERTIKSRLAEKEKKKISKS